MKVLTTIAAGITLLLALDCIGQIPAFPGAEGFGAMTTGGRGGAVIEVTNLNDAGSGSLRAAVEASGTRTVVFRVSGTIALQSRLSIQNGNITIAGQTAPGDGICLKNYTLTVSADNVIIRYIRSRLGDESDIEDDAMNGRNHKNIIIDHCSMSWSVDECASFYDNENFTMQWCLISESLYHSVHEKGNHGYGGIWGGKGATFHHNLLAHHSSRNPRFCGSRYSNQADLEKIDHRNNVIFNWSGNSCYGAEGGSYNIINNYYKAGPATYSYRNRIIAPNADNGTNNQAAGVWGMFYITGNYVNGYPTTTEDNWATGVSVSSSIKDQIKSDIIFSAPPVITHTAEAAFEHVLARAGAVLPKRDSIDTRIIYETLTGTAQYEGASGRGPGIIDTQSDVGGWPLLESATPPDDTDHDGMPDEWEDANGLNKNDAADRNGDLDGDGYTNLEDYLNSLVDDFEYMLRPVHFTVDTIIDMAVTLNWQDISDNETGFVIERKDESSWIETATVPANDTQYVDNSITVYGDYTYRMKSVNADMESFYTDTLVAAVQPATSSETGFTGKAELVVYPNPVTEQAWINFSLEEESAVEISLFDLTGRKIMLITHGIQLPGEYSYNLQADHLEGGIYLVRMTTENSCSQVRIIVSK